MVKDTLLFLFCIRLVDGLRAGIQWVWRYKNAYLYQLSLFLVDPDPPCLLIGLTAQLGSFGGVLGGVCFGNFGRLIHAMDV